MRVPSYLSHFYMRVKKVKEPEALRVRFIEFRRDYLSQCRDEMFAWLASNSKIIEKVINITENTKRNPSSYETLTLYYIIKEKSIWP